MTKTAMNRTLTENIDRGRTAIGLARQQGQDTTQWELSLAGLERQEMLAWASELGERELLLTPPVEFEEEPLRHVTITEVSNYAVRHLRFIANASLERQTGGWHIWTADWWTEQEQAAFVALEALRKALNTRLGEVV